MEHEGPRGATRRTRRRIGAAGLIIALVGFGALVQCGSSGQSSATDAGLAGDTLAGIGDGPVVDATYAADTSRPPTDGSLEGSSDPPSDAGVTVDVLSANQDVESIIESVAASPASYKLPDGRLVVSSFLAEARTA